MLLDYIGIKGYLDKETYMIYARSEKRCDYIIKQCKVIIDGYLKKNKLDKAKYCFIAVGSIGRYEALEASDLDIIPIVSDKKSYEIFKKHDKILRSILHNKLKIKVSKGEELTKLSLLSNLLSESIIGSRNDNSEELTKRVLIITEGVQVGGGLNIDIIKIALLNLYKNNTITSGRYILSFCNDIARYYRTLCIEYKAKIDTEGKDWCTRNAKLRCTRKFWYFSNLITIVSLAYEKNDEQKKYTDMLIKYFKMPPYLRIFNCLNENQIILGKNLLKYFAWYLNYMSSGKNREKLAKIKHSERYSLNDDNPFHMIKLISNMIHSNIFQILETMDQQKRQKIYDWFLL